MQPTVDPKNLISAMHYQAAGELMRLLDGFYSNIEDGLFELAYSNQDNSQQRKTIELMRELRLRRDHLIKTFGKRVQRSVQSWFEEDTTSAEYLEERIQADQLAGRCSGHFGFLVQSIGERAAHAVGRDMARKSVPVSPEEVSYHFIMSCRGLKVDREAMSMVQDLFHRFVLDRLGNVYGPINQQLEDAGYCTVSELQKLTISSA